MFDVEKQTIIRAVRSLTSAKGEALRASYRVLCWLPCLVEDATLYVEETAEREGVELRDGDGKIL